VRELADGPASESQERSLRRAQHALRASLRDGLAREVLLVTGAILLYFAVRNFTAGGAGVAYRNAERLFALEERLGVAWEAGAQAAIAGSSFLVTLANWVYIWGHWPVILASAVVLYLLRPERYHLLRNAMFVSGAIGFAFFALLPLAPPRLLELGLVDTVTERSSAYRALQPPGLTNQYAAFPSLHAGWNLLVGIVLFLAFAHVAVRAFAILSPLAMAAAVVLTANHFVLDVAAGYVVALVGLAAAFAIDSRRRGAATLADDGVDRDDGTERRVPAATAGDRSPRGQPPRSPAGGRADGRRPDRGRRPPLPGPR
jgi:hypothetical protein